MYGLKIRVKAIAVESSVTEITASTLHIPIIADDFFLQLVDELSPRLSCPSILYIFSKSYLALFHPVERTLTFLSHFCYLLTLSCDSLASSSSLSDRMPLQRLIFFFFMIYIIKSP